MEIHKTICDRCKKEILETPVRKFTIYNGNVRVDLCEDCYRFFHNWMEKPDDLEFTCESCREQMLKHLEKEDWADTVNYVMSMPFMKKEEKLSKVLDEMAEKRGDYE